jgi:hypothetical protein
MMGVFDLYSYVIKQHESAGADNDSNENTANYNVSLPCFDTWEMSPSYRVANQVSQIGSYFSSLNYKHMHASTHPRTHTHTSV